MEPIEEERIRNNSWVLVVGGEKKGRIYGIGVVTRTKHVDELTYHGSSSHYSEDIVQLKQEVLNYREDNKRLSQQ